MGKVYVQHTGSAWDFSGSIVKTGSANSGSFNTQGYNRLVGSIYISGSLTSGCGLRILQSIDGGVNWDITNSYAPSTIGASSYDIEVVGNKMLISASPGADNITAFRALFYLQPIGLGTVGLKVGSIDIGNVIVDEISKIQQQVSASISGGSVALLAGANDAGLVHVGTGTCIMGFVQLATGASDFGVAHIGTGASDIGVIHVGTGTCIMGMVQLATGASSIGEVTQAAGSNLHAVLETSSSIVGMVQLATGTSSIGAVTQSAGSNFHAVLETSTSSIGMISAASVTSVPWKSVWSASGTLSGSDAGIGDAVSGCADVTGFGRLTGILYLSASLAAASGLRVQQSGNNGANWDVLSACLPAAAGASSFGYEVCGNAVNITVRAGSSSVDYRSYWFARQGQ